MTIFVVIMEYSNKKVNNYINRQVLWKVVYKETKDFIVAEEFREELDRNIALREAFEKLTPGRQRGYLPYFSSAKQSKNRITFHTRTIPPCRQ